MYYIFVFKSRTSAMSFYENLKHSGVASIVINTPPAAQLGCGLSVKVTPQNLDIAQRILSCGAYISYLGLFRVNYINGRYEVKRV